MKNNDVIEIKEYLFRKREEILSEVDLFNKILESKKDELREINNKICTTFGHEFSNWEIDSNMEFSRNCSVCRLWEISKKIPVNYYVKVKKSQRFR